MMKPNDMKQLNDTHRDVWAGLICALLGGLIIYLSFASIPQEDSSIGGLFASSRFFPQLVAGVMIMLSIIMIFTAFFKKTGSQLEIKQGPEANQLNHVGKPERHIKDKRPLYRILAIVAILVIYTAFIETFGYFLLTPILMLFLFRLLGVKKWGSIILLSIVTSLAIGIFFSWILQVVLPEGILFA